MNYKKIKYIAKCYGFTGLKSFKEVGEYIEAESRHTGQRIRINVGKETVLLQDNLTQLFNEIE